MKKTTKKPKKLWVKKRHARVFAFLRFAMSGFIRLKYHYKAEKAPIKKGPCLILHNHQATMDPFFVSKAFRFPIYFITSDDLFNLKVSPLIRYLAAPIPKSKSMTDLAAVKNALRVLKEGGAVGIAPEGNRTFSGRQWETVPDAIAKLCKTAKVPVVLFNLCGGYGTDPRWGHGVRRGTKYVGRVKRILYPEDYKDMSVEELFEIIKTELNVVDADSGERYKSRKRAEFIERALYMCPVCKKIGTISSKGTHFTCLGCGTTAEYTEQLTIDPPFGGFTKIYEWYDWERAELTPRMLAGETLFDEGIRFIDSVKLKRKIFLDGHAVSMNKEAITITGENGSCVFPLSEIDAMAAVMKRKFNFYYRGKIYQIKGGDRFSAVKYVHAFNGIRAAQNAQAEEHQSEEQA